MVDFRRRQRDRRYRRSATASTRALAGATALILVVGCSPDTNKTTDSEGLSEDTFSVVLAEARDEGAGADQLAALEHAEQDREVTIEMAREATRRTVECITNAGLSAGYTERTTYTGLVIPGYEAGTSNPGDDVAWQQIESCDVAESYWINQLYQTQPTSWQARVDYANLHEAALRACLEENEIETDAQASGAELVDQAIDDSRTAGVCLREVGITSW